MRKLFLTVTANITLPILQIILKIKMRIDIATSQSSDVNSFVPVKIGSDDYHYIGNIIFLTSRLPICLMSALSIEFLMHFVI